MTDLQKFPSPKKLKLTVEQLRESNRRLELVTLALDDLIARVDEDLRVQRRRRLRGGRRWALRSGFYEVFRHKRGRRSRY